MIQVRLRARDASASWVNAATEQVPVRRSATRTVSCRAMRQALASCLVFALPLAACADGASTLAPSDPPAPAPPSVPVPPTPPTPPTTGSAERIFLADSSGRVIGAFVAGGRPAWSPDGRRLAYQRDGKVRLVDLGEDNDVAIADGGTPAWSPDAARLAISNGEGIAVINVDGSGLRVLVRHDFRDDTYEEWDMGVAKPSWSADGSEIAFEHLGDGDMQPAQLFAVKVSGGEPRLLTATFDRRRYAESDPSFSPDGTRVAFWSFGFGLAVVGADGIPRTLFANFPAVAYGAKPAWTPDGTRISFNLRRGIDGRSVAVMSATGGAVRELIPDAWDAVWSPDGARIAFVSTRDR
jgi:Tol biopolymer transport system component